MRTRKELASKRSRSIKTDFIKAQGNPEEELETVEKDIHKKQEELLKIWMNPEETARTSGKKYLRQRKKAKKPRSELKECSEECSAMEHDLELKQTLTAQQSLEMADDTGKAKQHSELSLRLT
ncbi:MAG: hypothetical protein ACLU3F_11365 [Blautia wexlerae]